MHPVTRSLAFLVVLVAEAAVAQPYADCADLFVFASHAQLPLAKSSGKPWDEGSDPDPEIFARPGAGAGASWSSVGAKVQDAASGQAYWNPVLPAEAKGAWIPVGPADGVALKLVDRDALADDTMAEGVLPVPGDVASAGLWRGLVQLGAAEVSLGISVTDGKRMCKGTSSAPPPVRPAVPSGLKGSPEAVHLNEVFAAAGCASTPDAWRCKRTTYGAEYRDLTGDGRSDLRIEPVTPDAGQDATWGYWKGTKDGFAKIFAANCSQVVIQPVPNGDDTQVVCHHADGQGGTFVDYKAGKARPARPKELEDHTF
ncbi:MAG: hypothetical protein RL653_1408 [Pseudomonadota bacterium]|jgi:hypothetical protein